MDGSQELKSMDHLELSEMYGNNRDNMELARLGKVPVLKRNFGFMPMLAFSCTVMITWEAILFLFAMQFGNGGSAGSVYGYIFIWLGTLSVFATMGELSSMSPTAGGQYHWVSQLAPPSMQKFLSYLIGWLTVTGWQAVVASGGFICGTLVQGMVVLGNPEYAPAPYQTTLLIWAVVLFAVFFNTVVSRALPRIESLILILHILGFFGILIPLVYMAPHGSASDVFTMFLNSGEWPSQGLSFLVGLLGPVFAFGGADGAVHMSEEIRNASTVVPRAMVFSIMINGTLGFGMLLAVLFCIGDPEQILGSPTGYPFMAVFEQATQSKGGALAMSAIVGALAIVATISWVASASRMLWSFARDRGMPGWQYVSRVNQRTSIPIISIIITTIIACLFSLINIGSSVAFNDVVSLSINGLYTSYFIGNALLLWRRMTGGIRSHSEHADIQPGSSKLAWGPWYIPEPLGTINNIFGLAFLTIVLTFSCFPQENHPTPDKMNYVVVMEGGVLLFAVVYYAIWGRKHYRGPVVEIQP